MFVRKDWGKHVKHNTFNWDCNILGTISWLLCVDFLGLKIGNCQAVSGNVWLQPRNNLTWLILGIIMYSSQRSVYGLGSAWIRYNRSFEVRLWRWDNNRSFGVRLRRDNNRPFGGREGKVVFILCNITVVVIVITIITGVITGWIRGTICSTSGGSMALTLLGASLLLLALFSRHCLGGIANCWCVCYGSVFRHHTSIGISFNGRQNGSIQIIVGIIRENCSFYICFSYVQY